MKQQKLLKTLIVAFGLTMGVSKAWADGNKRILDSQNYELATASDWTSANGTVSMGTGDATYGNYSKVNVSGSGNRTCAKTVSYAYEIGTGYSTADMTTTGYVVEFDMQMSGGNVKDRSVSQFFLGNSDYSVFDNVTYTGSDFVFSLSQPTNTENARSNTWYINDLSNATGEISIANNIWYHYKFIVSATSVDYIISHGTTEDGKGSMTVTKLPTVKGFYGLLGRGSGYIYFDNLEIYDYTASISISAPTFTFNKVDGAKRNYTIINPNGSGTLYYTTAPADVAPAEGDAAYTSTTESTVTVDFSESGNYYAYVLHTNGTTISPVTPQAVTAGALTLATPVFTVTDIVVSTDGFYYPVVTFASDNSKLEGAPTATFDVVGPYTFTEKGSFTVTASAEGYTSSSNTFTVNNKYSLSKTIDFGALTVSDFDNATWTAATGVPRNYWTDRAAAIPADVTYYKLTNTSETQGNPDNSAVLDGITISNYYQRAPEVYIGYGLLTPYDALSGSSNNMNFTVNGGTATDYIVYNGWNNYGSGTFNTVQVGNATFGLYRYDTMLRTIKVYSPNTITATIAADGYATFASPYALDLDNITGGTAYYVSATSETAATLTAASGTVAAGEGLILAGTAGDVVTIPVAASGTAIDGNKLVGCTAETTLVAAADKYVLVGGKFQSLADNGATIPAGKAYLNAPAGSRLALVFGEATGIKAVDAVEASNEVYNLEGQRVAAPQKGLYIVNGKKVIIK